LYILLLIVTIDRILNLLFVEHFYITSGVIFLLVLAQHRRALRARYWFYTLIQTSHSHTITYNLICHTRPVIELTASINVDS